MDCIFTKTYHEPEFNIKEILRYMGCSDESGEVLSLINQCIAEIRPKLAYRLCYRQFTIEQKGDIWDLSFVSTNSKDLGNNLKGCTSIILFAATIGIEIDRLIAKYGKLSPSKALCFQAIGAERIESLCNSFNNDMNSLLGEKGLFLRPRFSPGYGDFSLEVQKNIFRVLEPGKKIGVSLNDSLLMSPSKSVTAIIGVSPCNRLSIANRQCDFCRKNDCSYRR